MAVMVGYDSPIKTVDDLKGKKLGVITAGSLTEWIGKRIGTHKGWGRRHLNAERFGRL
jgi:NitT/TauT family transport system substrate-binding protein